MSLRNPSIEEARIVVTVAVMLWWASIAALMCIGALRIWRRL